MLDIHAIEARHEEDEAMFADGVRLRNKAHDDRGEILDALKAADEWNAILLGRLAYLRPILTAIAAGADNAATLAQEALLRDKQEENGDDVPA